MNYCRREWCSMMGGDGAERDAGGDEDVNGERCLVTEIERYDR